MSDPWHGPVKPGFFTGLGYNEENAYLGPSTPILTGIGKAVSKTVAGAAGAASSLYSAEASLGDRLAAAVGLHPDPENSPLKLLSDEMARTQAAAQKNVDALTPDATTTGTAFQIVHGVSEGASLAVAGAAAGGLPGAVALTSATEGSGTYEESLKAGTTPGVAAARAGVSAVASGAGVLIPGGFGSTLATRLLTGAASNVGLGFASRYADHTILEANGYPEMAAQQKVWDTTAVLTDAILGTAFGGLAHLHGSQAKAVEAAARKPGVVDAALVTNLAVQDRNLAVGVPVDPAATHAHADALEVSTQQLLEGKPNDVSQTGVNEAKFAARPIDEVHQADAQGIAREYMPERLADVHASIAEQLSQQRDQLVSDSAAFLRGNDERAAERELAQHEAARRDAQSANEAIEEPKEAAALRPEILARMEAEDRASYGEDWNAKQYAKLRGKAATKEARESAEQAQADYLQKKADAQGQIDDIDERVARQRNEVARLSQAEESFKALRAHDAAVREAGNDPAKLVEIIRNEQDRRALRDQLKPIEPTEENLSKHIAENPDAPVGGYLNTETGQVHLDDLKETRPFRLPERNVGQAHGEAARPNEGAVDRTGGTGTATPGTAAGAELAGNRAASAAATGAPRTEPGAATGPGAAGGIDPLTAKVHEALQDRPGLEVTNDEGKPMRAADLLRQVQEDAAREMGDFQKAVTAAINCFGRRGA